VAPPVSGGAIFLSPASFWRDFFVPPFPAVFSSPSSDRS
jgi:hypothetical protein